jgi:GTP-binding protein LepA
VDVREHALKIALSEGRKHGPDDVHVPGHHESERKSRSSAYSKGRHMAAPASNIRNFSIIAHIDHGKSTLADRILEITGAVDPRDHRPQLLDSMELERERGITIKAQAVRVEYTARDGKLYRLHLIDTPGHVDFTYEVSRSLAACDGALLLVDASQGVEAQTVANTYLAIDAGLELVPALNKIDLPGAEPERVAGEIHELLGEDDVIEVSAKSGQGVEELLEALVTRVPPPQGDPDAPARALIFDSEFDPYRGVVAYVRVVDGVLRKGERLLAMQTGTEADADEIGFFGPDMTPVEVLHAGEVGYLITGIKDVSRLRVGDTLTAKASPAAEPLPGYREVKPMVFCGLFPVDTDQFPELRDALEKLALNDAALSWEPETSQALGFGFRCGFLGLLHMDIVRERLEREYDLELLATTPNVEYEVTLTDGSEVVVHSPSEMPDRAAIASIREPYIRATILCPKEHVGAVMELCQERRGTHVDMAFLSQERVQLHYDLPLGEIVLDFFDQLKSRTRGYASLDYELLGMRESDLVKLDILLAGDKVDALSMVVHRDKAYAAGRALTERLRSQIPRQQFEVAIQAAIGSKVIARESVKPIRKDVIAKCYGGDVTRKRKLLEKQKEGKKRMKQVGRVEVPQEAFLAVLELDS